jgi:hypothetical protein
MIIFLMCVERINDYLLFYYYLSGHDLGLDTLESRVVDQD